LIVAGARRGDRALLVDQAERVDLRIEPLDALQRGARGLDRRELSAAIELAQLGGAEHGRIGVHRGASGGCVVAERAGWTLGKALREAGDCAMRDAAHRDVEIEEVGRQANRGERRAIN
jgi:hypothetical protein